MDVAEGARRLRARLVEAPGSIGERRRQRRWELLVRAFPQIAHYRVIDLGGTPRSWLRAPVRPACVLVVNLAPLDDPAAPWLAVEQADACDLPEQVGARGFDLVFSNSLLEHVGGYARRAALARAVHRLAPRHWVQTPYRYFPLEPHFLFPGMQFLPVRWRRHVAARWPLAHSRTPAEQAVAAVLSVELVSRTELRHHFPDSHILVERVGPLVKSLIAVRGAERTTPRPARRGGAAR